MADPTTAQRKVFAKMGFAMPDGSYYVRQGSIGASDLQNAIEAVGRGEAAGDDGAAIRKHIMARAAALKLSDKIPDTWNPDGTLKHEDVDDFLAHYGVPGMKWGHRKARGEHSDDSAKALELHQRVKTGGGAHVLSNDELEALNKRLNLEQNHARLTSNSEHVSVGEKATKQVLGVAGNAAKGGAQTVAQKIIVKGIETGLKKAGVPGL